MGFFPYILEPEYSLSKLGRSKLSRRKNRHSNTEMILFSLRIQVFLQYGTTGNPIEILLLFFNTCQKYCDSKLSLNFCFGYVSVTTII